MLSPYRPSNELGGRRTALREEDAVIAVPLRVPTVDRVLRECQYRSYVENRPLPKPSSPFRARMGWSPRLELSSLHEDVPYLGNLSC